MHRKSQVKIEIDTPTSGHSDLQLKEVREESKKLLSFKLQIFIIEKINSYL